jgi:hypothetical protein
MQLRYLQTLNNIATEQNSTIIFPVPVDLFSLVQKNQMNVVNRPSTNPFSLPSTSLGDNNMPMTGRLTTTNI